MASLNQPILHGGDKCTNAISRTTDIPLAIGGVSAFFAKFVPLSLANILSYFYDPWAAGIGAGAAFVLGNKKIIRLPGEPTTASLFANPYVKAASVFGAFLLLLCSSTASAFSFGFLACCRLQKSMPEKGVQQT